LWSKIGLKSRKVKLFRIIFYTAYKMRGASGREMMRYDAMQLHAGSPFFWKQRGIATRIPHTSFGIVTSQWSSMYIICSGFMPMPGSSLQFNATHDMGAEISKRLDILYKHEVYEAYYS
jgi:hypothetical protein